MGTTAGADRPERLRRPGLKLGARVAGVSQSQGELNERVDAVVSWHRSIIFSHWLNSWLEFPLILSQDPWRGERSGLVLRRMVLTDLVRPQKVRTDRSRKCRKHNHLEDR